jgi:hypothetical protein
MLRFPCPKKKKFHQKVDGFYPHQLPLPWERGRGDYKKLKKNGFVEILNTPSTREI